MWLRFSAKAFKYKQFCRVLLSAKFNFICLQNKRLYREKWHLLLRPLDLKYLWSYPGFPQLPNWDVHIIITMKGLLSPLITFFIFKFLSQELDKE
jgi:hypothetical protein